MRVLALDIGEKLIGVAVSDPSGTVATPVTDLGAAGWTGERGDLLAAILLELSPALEFFGYPTWCSISASIARFRILAVSILTKPS